MENKEEAKISILLGGVGGDSHSVGLNILRQALGSKFDVYYIGIQNDLEDFFRQASKVNAVLISCMDGHAKRYLREFINLRLKHPCPDTKWYIGGNLCIGESFTLEKEFLDMGFTRAFVKFVDIKTILEILEADFDQVDVISPPNKQLEVASQQENNVFIIPNDEKLKNDFFLEARKEVLNSWKTGHRASNFEENAQFLKDTPNWFISQSKEKERTGPLIQPRSGVALVEDQINYFNHFKKFGADHLSYQVDSLTRNNNYVEAEEEIQASKQKIHSLNGFPLVNHGVDQARKVCRTINVPLQTRHSTRKPELLAEISFAAGVTSYEGGCICYNIPYYKNYSLEESIANWQYVDYLTGFYYKEYGIVLDREYFGVLTATLIPPSLAIVVGILQTLLAAQQGVKSVSLGYAEQGNRIQDIAAIESIRELSKEYLENFGFNDVHVFPVMSQYMAAFPQISQLAENLIYESAKTAKFAGATRVVTKTPVEAIKIPTLMDNIEGINLVIRGIKDGDYTQRFELENDINHEKKIIKMEVQDIMEQVLIEGKGEISKGIVNCFKKGFIDIPFSPSLYNQGKVVTMRDENHAVRFFDTGSLPFRKEVKQFHEEKIHERFKKEGIHDKEKFYYLVEKDVLQIARSQFDKWPLSP